jgi:hypothetical protein
MWTQSWQVEQEDVILPIVEVSWYAVYAGLSRVEVLGAKQQVLWDAWVLGEEHEPAL